MMRHILKRLNVPSAVRWIVLITWMAIFLTYLLQTESHPVLSTGIPPGPPTLEREAFFSSVHLAAYVLNTALWAWALVTIMSLRRALITTFVIVILMSVLTELGQTLTPDRHFQWIDLAANLGGLVIGLIGFGIVWAWVEQIIVQRDHGPEISVV